MKAILACLASSMSFFLLLYAPACAQDNYVAQAGNNIGRTEENDSVNEDPDSEQLGTLGAVTIKLNVPEDCEGTVGIYSKEGQLIRILGQCLSLKKGDYNIRWDGLDLFGNLVPPEKQLELKLIYNKPLKAFYEMSVSAPKVCAWGGTFGEGAAKRSGGWLADHSPPNSVLAIGDQILIGASLAEHGNNLIAVNHDGEKLWGTNLAGWTGPRRLVTDGTNCYALDRTLKNIYKVDPVLKVTEQGERLEKKLIYTERIDAIQHIAVNQNKLYMISTNHERDRSPFRIGLARGNIDYTKSRPQVLDTSAPTEFMISPQAAFGNVFTEAGNPQNTAGMVIKNAEGFVLVVFKSAQSPGTIVVGNVDRTETLDIYALKSGLKYDDEKHSPLNNNLGGDLGINFSEMDDNWIKVGQAKAQKGMNFLTMPEKKLDTTAIYFKATPLQGKNPNWRPSLKMARMMDERFKRVDVRPELTVHGEIEKQELAESGWKLRSKFPCNHVYPVKVVMDLKTEQSIDGLAFLNCTTPHIEIQRYIGKAELNPSQAEDEQWESIGTFRGKYNRKLGYLSASISANEQYVSFPDRVTTRALRYTITQGYRSGKWGSGPDDAYKLEVEDIALIQLIKERPVLPTHILRVADAENGKPLSEARDNSFNVSALYALPDGTFYSLYNNRLCRTTFGTVAQHEPLGQTVFKNPVSLYVGHDRILVGDQGNYAIYVLDRSGKLLFTIGEKGPRKRGPWNPDVINRPTGITIASDGSIWVAEESFSPKRVARYSAEGKFIDEFLGPPMYGGGGHLDPNLKAFYDRSMEFELDWGKGTSRLKNLNDRMDAPESPIPTGNSFQYTTLSKPYYQNGKRYIVQGTTITQLESDTWRGCVVMGSAENSEFLMNKPVWNRHWGRLDLSNKLFIWCDKNDDGEYQIDEVELFDAPEGGRGNSPFNSLTMGPDFGFWGENARIKPYTITKGGTPLFKSADFQPFSYDAPHYPRNYTTAGPRSCKPAYSGFKYVTLDGGLIQEGQPYIVQADGTILGGKPTTTPSDYIPPISGKVLHTPWGFAGGGMTSSQVGEIAVVNSAFGYWFVWAPHHGVVIGRFFTGETGGWGWGLPNVRGFDVSGRKHAWEGWHADFIKAHNGNFYAQGGKGFHAIARIEGLNDFKIQTQPINFSAQEFTANEKLRPALRDWYNAAKATPKTVAMNTIRNRVPNFKLDGDIEDWGRRDEFNSIGIKDLHLLYDICQDEKGVYIAINGSNHMKTSNKDTREMYRNGFCIDLQWRKGAARSRDIQAGDKRLVIGKFDGRWVPMLYDYVNPAADPSKARTVTTAIGATTVSAVRELGKDECHAIIKEDTLGLDANDLSTLDHVVEAPTMPGQKRENTRAKKGDLKNWTAEIFIPWSTLGVAPETSFSFDIGILDADPKLDVTNHRYYWSNTSPAGLSDELIELLINPVAMGLANYSNIPIKRKK